VPQACAGGARVWLVRRKKPYVNDTVGDWSLLGAQTALSEYLDRSSRAGVPICSLRRTRRNLTRDAGTRSSNTTKMPRALTVVEVRQMLALLSYDDLAIGRDERTSSPSCWRPDSGAHRESGCARCMRTPLLSHGIGTALITLYVVGRTSRSRYTIPVTYVPYNGALLFGTPFRWDQPDHRHTDRHPVQRPTATRRRARGHRRGRRRGLYEVMLRANRNFATFNKIRVDQAGSPNAEHLHASLPAGTRAFLLSPR
jgi:hypothetical protein